MRRKSDDSLIHKGKTRSQGRLAARFITPSKLLIPPIRRRDRILRTGRGKN
jgi:hypothetical protein